jgi:hypothetical protein
MTYKIKSKKLKENKSFEIKEKNLFLKLRKVDNPYEVWKSADGTWEWRVLKKWQVDDDKPYARWFCAVKSPFTYGKYDMGDVYVKDIKENAQKVEGDEAYKEDFARDEEGKISNTKLSFYGEKKLKELEGSVMHFSDGDVVLIGNKLIDKKGKVLDIVDSDRKVNKIIFKTI